MALAFSGLAGSMTPATTIPRAIMFMSARTRLLRMHSSDNGSTGCSAVASDLIALIWLESFANPTKAAREVFAKRFESVGERRLQLTEVMRQNGNYLP
jgi:hypothetical protein